MGKQPPKKMVTALRRLAKELQSHTRTGEEKGLPNEIAYDDGFCDGLNQAGYQLKVILEEWEKSCSK